MGTATTLVGLLPTYATIGVAAPIILFVLRFCQGLAVGGQWGGAVLLATEYAPEDKRGFYGSFAQVGVPVGLVLGNSVFLILTAIMKEGNCTRRCSTKNTRRWPTSPCIAPKG